jgi:hypothetical protein
MELEVGRQADAKLLEQEFLLCSWRGDAAQADLATISGGKNDVGALQGGKQRDRPHGRHWLDIINAARRWLWGHHWPPLQQVFERDPQRVARRNATIT